MTAVEVRAGAVVAATGEPVVMQSLTPEQEDVLLAHIDRHGPTPAATFETLLGISKSHMQRFLHELADRGHIRSELDRNRLVWSRVKVEFDEKLVREAHQERIREVLSGRRDTASGIAKALNLPLDEVAATCVWMMLHGALSATSVGSIRIYTVGPRVVTHTDTARAASIPMSPEAKFQAQLDALPPERAIHLRAERPVKPAPKPKVPKAPKVKPMRPLVEAARAAGMQPGQVRGLVNRDRIKHQGVGKQALVDVADLKAYKPRMRKKKDMPERQRRARPEVERVYADLDGYKRVTDAAHELGVQPSALFKWLEHNDKARALCVKQAKYLMVPPAALALYIAATLVPGATYGTVVPEGGLTIWEAVKQLGWSYGKVYRMLADGQLTGMQVGGVVYFDPVPLAALRAQLEAESAVPEGWISLKSLCDELKLHASSVVSWMRRRKVEIRKYRDHQRQVAIYLPVDAADAYRLSRTLVPGGVKITPEVAQAILAEIPPVAPGRRRPPGMVPPVAARYGLSIASVQKLLHANPRQDELLTHPALSQPEPIVEDLEPPIEAQPEPPIADLEPPMDVVNAETPEAPSPTPAPRPYVTLELEQQLRAELTPERRKLPGETARVAEKYGLSVKQVRNALSRIPVQKVG